MTPKEALQAAIRILGSQTAVAAAAGEDVETGHVYYWLNTAPEVPAKYCPGIQRATREKGETVYCEQLCPSTPWELVRSDAGPEPRKTTKRPKPERAQAAPSIYTERQNATREVLERAVGKRDGSNNRRGER